MPEVNQSCERFTDQLPGTTMHVRHVNYETYRYGINCGGLNTDPFVRYAMKDWSRPSYKSIFGYTKRANLDIGLEALLKFSHPETKRSALLSESDIPEVYAAALKDVRDLFCPGQGRELKMISIEDVAMGMDLSTSAGYSFPQAKKKDVVDDALIVTDAMLNRMKLGKKIIQPPCKLGLRGHLAPSEKPKTRPVWIYPFELTLMEGQWALPLYSWVKENIPQVHFGENAMPRLAELMNAYRPEYSAVTLDWSAFDTTIPCFLIDDVFKIVRDCFSTKVRSMGQHDVKISSQERSFYRRQLDYLKEYFMKTKLMLPNGVVIQKNHGIPSGSTFTQIIGSMVNMVVIRFLARAMRFNTEDLKVLGDDSFFFLHMHERGRFSTFEASRLAKRFFGLELNPDKVRITEEGGTRKFLGYTFKGLKLFREDEDWLKMCLYSEHTVSDPLVSLARVHASYMLGGVNSALFCSFYSHFIAYLKRRGVPMIVDFTLLPVTMRRMFKYVLQLSSDGLITKVENANPHEVALRFTVVERSFCGPHKREY